MRYFIGLFVLLVFYAGCSSTETVVEEEAEPEPETEERTAPSWYSEGTHSSTDSLSIHGYAFASAADSSEAAELSTETALRYLRFEIDRTVEEIREELAESAGGDTYSSPEFIIRLRNTVQGLSLANASTTHWHDSSADGVHYSYTRSSIPRSDLYSLIADQLEDSRFLQELRN